MMNKSKIDWCDFSWNPVTGCTKGCYYCYARKQSRRFCGDVRLNLTSEQITNVTTPAGRAYILDQPFKNDQGKVIAFPAAFVPTLHRYRLTMPERKKKPVSIFVCSMGDLFGPSIPTRWILDVLDACFAAPWHNYLFLTKYPERYRDLDELALLPHGDNFWYGATITRMADLERLRYLPPTVHRFISLEPIMESMDLNMAPGWVNWIIVGAETGNHQGKHLPRQEWLEAIASYARTNKVPLLLKDSEELRDIWGNNLIQEFPKGLEPVQATVIPHCKACKHASATPQGKRGVAYACEIGWTADGYDDRIEARHIPGRYTRSSPPWCPLRKEDAHHGP